MGTRLLRGGGGGGRGGLIRISFFAYNMGHPRSVSPASYMETLSDQFFCLLWGPPQITFFAYYMEVPSGHPVSFLLTIWDPPRVNYFAYFVRAISGQFLLLLYGAPLDQFLCLLRGNPLRLVSLHTI